MNKIVNLWNKEPAVLTTAIVAVLAVFGLDIADQDLLRDVLSVILVGGSGFVIRSKVTPTDGS